MAEFRRKSVRDFTPGQSVLYSPSYGRTEKGMVVGSTDYYVFVKYADGVKATRPEDLIHAWWNEGGDHDTKRH